MPDFIPASHLLTALFQHLFNLGVQIRLQTTLTIQIVVFDELLNLRIVFPLLVIWFIAADMEVLIREELNHFVKHARQHLIEFGIGRVH